MLNVSFTNKWGELGDCTREADDEVSNRFDLVAFALQGLPTFLIARN